RRGSVCLTQSRLVSSFYQQLPPDLSSLTCAHGGHCILSVGLQAFQSRILGRVFRAAPEKECDRFRAVSLHILDNVPLLDLWHIGNVEKALWAQVVDIAAKQMPVLFEGLDVPSRGLANPRAAS